MFAYEWIRLFLAICTWVGVLYAVILVHQLSVWFSCRKNCELFGVKTLAVTEFVVTSIAMLVVGMCTLFLETQRPVRA